MGNTKALEVARQIGNWLDIKLTEPRGLHALANNIQAFTDEATADLRAQLAERDAENLKLVGLLADERAEHFKTRKRFAERDAQLAAERAITDKLSSTLGWVAAHTEIEATLKHDALEAYWKHFNATRQPTQDKGGE